MDPREIDAGPPTWRLIDSGPGEGAWNMAVDEAILRGCADGLSPPTCRLYCWKVPTLSVGFAQPLKRDV
ncbi:MAG: hypothetical protein ACE5LX_08290, partial [Nitrospinota bacterium]